MSLVVREEKKCSLTRVEGSSFDASFDHLTNHVIKDSAVAEVSQLHVRVKTHHHLERLPGVQLEEERVGRFEDTLNNLRHRSY